MKRTAILAAALAALGAAAILSAEAVLPSSALSSPAVTERMTTFAVKNMTCPLCPITVRKAMEHVHGVTSVKVDFGAKTATVVYNPAVANIKAIAEASMAAGYPAAAVRSGR